MILQAYSDAEVQRVRMIRGLNFEMASLMRLGFHNSKAFPSYDAYMGPKKQQARPEDLHDYLHSLSTS